MVAGAGIAAIVAAALVGWDIYSHTQTTTLTPCRPEYQPAVARSPAKPGASGSAATGGKHSSTPAGSKQGTAPPSPGHSPSSGKPSAGPSAASRHRRRALTAARARIRPRRPARRPPRPRARPRLRRQVPRAPGQCCRPATCGITSAPSCWARPPASRSGFRRAWTQNLTGKIAHFNQPAKNYHLTVSVGLWTYAKPLAQAKYLAKKDARQLQRLQAARS